MLRKWISDIYVAQLHSFYLSKFQPKVSRGQWVDKLNRLIAKYTVCLFVCLSTSSSSTLRGLVKNLDGNENKDMNININIDYSLVIFLTFLVGRRFSDR